MTPYRYTVDGEKVTLDEIVMATIYAKAVKAAFIAPESNSDYSHEREMSEFNFAVRGLANNLRLAA